MHMLFKTLKSQGINSGWIKAAALLLLLQGTALFGQYKKLHVGIALREDVQLAARGGTAESPESNARIQQRIASGIGVFANRRSLTWGWNASVILTGARYKPEIRSGTRSLDEADLKFTQVNLSAVFFPGGRSFFLEAGPQWLHRRYGTEFYTVGITDNSYWPKNRLMFNMGAGTELEINGNTYCRFSAGLRINPAANRVVYDNSINQIWASASIGLFQTGKKSGAKTTKNCYSL
jgi:hypothetical protein